MPKGTRTVQPNMYMLARNQAGISREEAADKLHIGSRTLARIELGESIPAPGDVLNMAELYGQSTLSARYCAEECPIGRKYAYHVEQKDFPVYVLGLLKEYNDIQVIRDKLVEIAADGRITEEEVPVFEEIMSELMDLEQKIEGLKLWAAKIIPVDELIRQKKEKSA